MKRNKCTLLIFSLFFLSLTTSLDAQDTGEPDSCAYTMNGRVLDLESREPIPFVTVQVRNSQRGAFTDENGNFSLSNLCRKEFDFTVSHVGYKTATHHHDIYHESPVVLMASDNQLLSSVVVEGEYNPTSISTIDIDQLSQRAFTTRRSESLGDLASSLTGISVLTTGQNIVKPIIHGLHSNRILIINNEVRHEFQNWGAEHAPEIDPSLARSLEVVKGAATVRYGPDALGGVLLINPPRPELSSGFDASVSMTGKSNGRSGEGDLSVGYGWENLVLYGQASWLRQGDLHAPDYQLTNTGKHELSYSGAFRFHQKRFDLEGYYSRFNQNLGILRASVNGNLQDLVEAIENEVPEYTRSFSYEISSPRQEVTHDLMKLKGSYTMDDQELSFQYAYQMNERREYDVRRGTNAEVPSIDLELYSHSLDLDWSHPQAGNVTGTAGIQWLYQDNNNISGTNTIPFIPNYNNTRVGIFAIENLEVGQTTYEAGLRYDYQFTSIRGREPDNDIFRNKLKYSQFTGSLGIKQQFSQEVALRSNLGTAWRPPNVSELYSFGKHQASFEYGLFRYQRDENSNISTTEVVSQEDRAVKPEIGLKWITTLESSTNATQWEVTGYLNYIKNYIYTRPAGITNSVRGAFPYFIYDQDDALFWGVDLALEREIFSCLEMKGQASYVWARDIANKDHFIGIPPARVGYEAAFTKKPDFLSSSSAGLDLAYTFPYWQEPKVIPVRRIFEAEMNDENPFAEDDSNFDFVEAPDGFFIANIFWNARKGSWEWTFQVKNLFNTKYRLYTDRLRYFADQRGRNFLLTISYTIN